MRAFRWIGEVIRGIRDHAIENPHVPGIGKWRAILGILSMYTMTGSLTYMYFSGSSFLNPSIRNYEAIVVFAWVGLPLVAILHAIDVRKVMKRNKAKRDAAMDDTGKTEALHDEYSDGEK